MWRKHNDVNSCAMKCKDEILFCFVHSDQIMRVKQDADPTQKVAHSVQFNLCFFLCFHYLYSNRNSINSLVWVLISYKTEPEISRQVLTNLVFTVVLSDRTHLFTLSFMTYSHCAKTTPLLDEFFKFNVPFILSGGNDRRKFSLSYSLSISVKTPLQIHFSYNVWPYNQGFTVIQCTHLYHVQHASVVVSKLFLVEETPFLVLGRHRFHATLPVFALQHDRLKEHRDQKTLRLSVLALF